MENDPALCPGTRFLDDFQLVTLGTAPQTRVALRMQMWSPHCAQSLFLLPYQLEWLKNLLLSLLLYLFLMKRGWPMWTEALKVSLTGEDCLLS